MSRSDFLTRLSHAVRADDLFASQEAVVVGVSGGPDSMALLHGLAELARAEGAGYKLHVGHLNHRLRGSEAGADAEFVAAAARELGLACSVGCADLGGGGGAASPGGLEESARRQRYEFLERVCLQRGANVLAVGHHADDNAETILHHIVRGTGLRGLRGMLPRREIRPGSSIQLVRPLLRFRRQELVEFLSRRGMAYRRDASNQSLDHTRNRIRHRVLPMLCDQINPQSVEALLRLGEQARWMEAFVGETAERLLGVLTVRRDEDSLVLSGPGLGEQPHILRLELLRRAVSSFGLGERQLSFAHLTTLAELADAERAGGSVQLSGGLRVERVSNNLVFSTARLPTDSLPLPEVLVALPGTTRLPGTPWCIDTRIEPVEAARAQAPGSAGPDEEWLDYAGVNPPLLVRGPRSGDRFHPLGAPGSKKLADFFIDQKIPPAERRRTPVLCDRRGPLWVIPHRLDDRVKVTGNTTRLLKVAART